MLCRRHFAKGKKAGKGGDNRKVEKDKDSASTKKEIEMLTKFLEEAERCKR